MIYIAAPYSHSDQKVIDFRVKTVAEYSAKLLLSNNACISPITTGTGILLHVKLPTDFNFWGMLSIELLKCCKELHVLMLDGWDKSTGVAAEIKFAVENNIHIKYIKI